MAFCTILSAAISGINAEIIRVEVDVGNGLPLFHMVGYLSGEVKEASERVRTAIKNSGIELKPRKIVVNLSPAKMKKRGSAFDLPIALAVIMAYENHRGVGLENAAVVGELSLDGKVRRVSGILSIVSEVKNYGCQTCIVPKGNVREASLVEGIKIIGVECIREAYSFVKCGETPPSLLQEEKKSPFSGDVYGNYSDVAGQVGVKRAIEVAVAGGHNILMIGPPGSGKTMIASRIPTILPPLTRGECLDLTKVYSVAGRLDENSPLMTKRPFREVHSSISRSAFLGGGVPPRPGEISFASKGVLFLDELTEFRREIVESLRQPLEDRKIVISRGKDCCIFPADFMLVAAMNPCKCGYYPDREKCTCTGNDLRRYLGKLSRPFMDRMDMCVETSRIRYEEFSGVAAEEETSEEIQKRVMSARKIQEKRYAGKEINCNAMLGVGNIKEFCRLSEKEEDIMKNAYEKLNLTARTLHKTLKVARTIADLANSEKISPTHLREAISYRTINIEGGGKI